MFQAPLVTMRVVARPVAPGPSEFNRVVAVSFPPWRWTGPFRLEVGELP